jgi:predicted O-methyltransferase YrrM
MQAALDRARKHVPNAKPKREIALYQAAALYALAAPYNGKRILEIGTALGYSAAVLAEACPDAEIITLNPNEEEALVATRNLSVYPRVKVLPIKSWDFLTQEGIGYFDLIFVDGDHKRVRADLPFYNRLQAGGLLLFHDYSPEGATQGKGGAVRECPPVYQAVNSLVVELGKKAPDVTVIDDGGVGMAGLFALTTKGTKMSKKTTQLSTCYLYSLLGYEQLDGMYDLAGTVKDLPGAIVECGCGDGGSLAALALGARRDKFPLKRTVWGLDTFAGIPQPNPIKDGDKALGRWRSQQVNGGWCVGNSNIVQEVMKTFKIAPVRVVPGLFADTLPSLDTGDIAILHIDATLYQSTKEALALCDSVVEGGLIIVSAYHHWFGVKNAVDEWLKGRQIAPLLLTLNVANVWWRKS